MFKHFATNGNETVSKVHALFSKYIKLTNCPLRSMRTPENQGYSPHISGRDTGQEMERGVECANEIVRWSVHSNESSVRVAPGTDLANACDFCWVRSKRPTSILWESNSKSTKLIQTTL